MLVQSFNRAIRRGIHIPAFFKPKLPRVLTHDNPEDLQRLHIVSEAVEFPLDLECQSILELMEQKRRSLQGFVGLAAPQIDIHKRIILIEIPGEVLRFDPTAKRKVAPTFLINPTFDPIESYGMSVDYEACYSLPGMLGPVERYNSVRYKAFDSSGKEFRQTAHGLEARLVQHEIDHLDGRLVSDRLIPGGELITEEEYVQQYYNNNFRGG